MEFDLLVPAAENDALDRRGEAVLVDADQREIGRVDADRSRSLCGLGPGAAQGLPGAEYAGRGSPGTERGDVVGGQDQPLPMKPATISFAGSRYSVSGGANCISRPRSITAMRLASAIASA